MAFEKVGAPRSTRTSAALAHDGTLTSHSLLQQLDAQTGHNHLGLSTVAKDDSILLRDGFKINLACFSQKELTGLLDLAQRMLRTIRYAHQHCLSTGFLLCNDNELDSTFIANLEHLLLCLHTVLICALVALGIGLVQQHVIDCQREQSIRAQDWFFEFPDVRHPQTTTWPWSIRPSLAVLWGVCWMFASVDRQGNLLDAEGNIIKTAQEGNELWEAMGGTCQQHPQINV